MNTEPERAPLSPSPGAPTNTRLPYTATALPKVSPAAPPFARSLPFSFDGWGSLFRAGRLCVPFSETGAA